MKQCAEKDCPQKIEDKYTYCYEHFKPGQKTDYTASASKWHSDDVVDQLMKINNNLSRILQEGRKDHLEKIDLLKEIMQKLEDK